MKKKLITILLVMIIAMSTTFAAVFQFGASAALPLPIDTENPENMANQFKDFANYQFGADLRITIPFNNVIGLGFGFPTMMSFAGETANLTLNIKPTIDLVFAPNSFASIELGAGYDVGMWWDKDWGYNLTFDAEHFADQPIWYHAGIGLDLKALGLNISYYLPAPTDTWKPELAGGKLVCGFYLMNF